MIGEVTMPNSNNFDTCASIKELLQNEYIEFRNVMTRLEFETGSVSVVALNELRNAIEYLARAVDEQIGFNKEEQIKKAKAHFLRGIIDVKEALIIPKLSRLRNIQGPLSVEAESIFKQLSKYKANFSDENRSQEDYLKFLDEIDRSMEHADNLLKEHQYELEYAIKKDKQILIWKAMLWASFGALAFALASYIATNIGL